MHERQGSIGNFDLTTTAAGTSTTPDELFRSGATTFDTPQEVERKLAATRDPSSTLVPLGSPSAAALHRRPANRSRARTLGLVVVLLLALFAFKYFEPRGPQEWPTSATLSKVSDFDKSNPIAKEEYESPHSDYAAKFSAQFGHLYTNDAPLSKFYEFCDFKGCRDADMGVFKSLKKYAKSPETYWDEACTAAAMKWAYNPVKSFEPRWGLSQKGGETTCALQNADAMSERYLEAQKRYDTLLLIGLALAVLALTSLLWRKTKNLPH